MLFISFISAMTVPESQFWVRRVSEIPQARPQCLSDPGEVSDDSLVCTRDVTFNEKLFYNSSAAKDRDNRNTRDSFAWQ